MPKRTISFVLYLMLLALFASSGFICVSALDESVEPIDQYEDYLAEIEDITLGNFVDYESVSSLGDFDGFLSYSEYYQYNLIDDNGYTASLSVYHTSADEEFADSFATELSMEGVTDLRNHPSGTSGHFVLNNCTYIYYEGGRLGSIRWESNGIYFQLRCEEIQDDNLHDNADTLMNRLLSMDSAEDATQELLEIAKGKLTYKTQAIVAGIVGIVALIVIGDILYRIHRRREKIPAEPMDI